MDALELLDLIQKGELQNSGNMFADEILVNGTTINDIDDDLIKQFIKSKTNKSSGEIKNQ